MKEIGYDYARNGRPPKYQYYQAKRVYDVILNLKNNEDRRGIIALRGIIDTRDLNLIKYAMKLYDFNTNIQMNALSGSSVGGQLDIVKYFYPR